MEFAEILVKAWDDVQSADLPEDLREIAFAEAISHYRSQAQASASTTPPASVTVSAAPAAETQTVVHGPPQAGSGPLAAIHAETRVPMDVLEALYYVDGEGVPGINVTARKLGGSKAERTRAIAILIATARHFALNEIDISVETIREQCSALNSYDQNNFTAYLGSTPGVNFTGPKGKKVVRVKSDIAKVFAAKAAAIIGATEVE